MSQDTKNLPNMTLLNTASLKKMSQKICLLGDFSVGKTSLVKRFVEDRFDDKYLSTIGAKISRRVLETEAYQFTFLLWDLAGGENFQHVTKSYMAGASGALIVCDLTRPETLNKLYDCVNDVRESNPSISLVLLANKYDLIEERRITDEQLEEASQQLGVPLCITSAKSGENVELAFQLLAADLEKKVS